LPAAKYPGTTALVPVPDTTFWASIVTRTLPSFSPTMIVPTFDELTRMSVTDQLTGGCGSWSAKTASAMGSLSGTTRRESGVTSPSSMAPEIVMTLLVEPGS
jgi:hypothetical protein